MPEGATIEVSADPTVLYYLKVQAAILVGFALLIGLGALVTVLFAKELKPASYLWLGLAVVALVLSVWVVVRTATLDTPALTLEGQVFRVGEAELTLDDTTEISYAGDPADLPRPEGKTGYAALPGMTDLPPSFAGGPTIRVRSRQGEVAFRPLLYSSRFLPEPRPEMGEMVTALLEHGEAGNARDWLEAVAPDPEVRGGGSPSFGTFMIWYLVFATPVLGFLLVTVIIGLRKKLAD